MRCERPECRQESVGDLLYCSDRCYDLDNDPTPITVRSKGATNTFTAYTRQPVIIPPG